jgi:hypothetical protein
MQTSSHGDHRGKGTEVPIGIVLEIIRATPEIIITRTHYTSQSQNFNIQGGEILPCKNPSFQLPRVSLHLIPMLIRASKKVRTTMYIKHNPLPRIPRSLPLICIGSHLNPLCLKLATRSAPLPPVLSTDFPNTMMTQLLCYRFCTFGDVVLGDLDLVNEDPAWMGHPLCSETLDIFNGMMGGVQQEFPNQV